nr:CRISPR-associated endoribonuclease Cas6 [Bacteroidota bacterium]
MRIKIEFKLSGKRQVLPLNYQYPLSAWIYKVLERGDREFSAFLHEQGFKMENQKTFKLFTFSNLQFPRNTSRHMKRTDRLEIFADRVWLTLAFQIPVAAEKFVAGLFNDQEAEIGDRISKVEMDVGTIEMLKEPEFTERMIIHTLSPIVVTRKTENDKQEQYLKPGDADYDFLFFKNLLDKYNAYQRQMQQETESIDTKMLQFKCLTENPKSQLQHIKAFTIAEVKVRGYRFDFEIIAPPALIKTGLDSGFGAMNAVGFGCGEVINNT